MMDETPINLVAEVLLSSKLKKSMSILFKPWYNRILINY